MSGEGPSTNNKFPPPSSHDNVCDLSLSSPSDSNNSGFSTKFLSTEAIRYHRSSNYYLDEEGIVFLASNVLFKLQPSFLAADPGVKDFEFKPLMRTALDGSKTRLDRPGASDKNPVALPEDVRASQFRDFLMAILGRIGDSAYTNLITAAQNPLFHRWQCICCFANIGGLAVRFGMDQLDHWVQSQIQQIFRVSIKQLAVEEWEKEAPLRLIKYMHTTRLPRYRDDILAYMQFFLSGVANGLVSASRSPSSTAVFTDLFKDQTLPTDNNGLFGLIFSAILSFGHHSPIWTEHVTREQRRILFAAHASLTRLCDHTELQVNWLAQPSMVKDVCSRSECTRSFYSCWNNSFSSCKRLDSLVPLEDIRQMVQLPSYRRLFANQRHSWHCEAQCANKTMSKIDKHIELSFRGMTEKYNYWSSVA